MKNYTLCYLINGTKWLMLHRIKKENDINHGKWIGIGGKVEVGESIRECMYREVMEETGLKLNNLNYTGVLYFSYDGYETEKIWVYTSNDFDGTIHTCDEGHLEWIEEKNILDLNLWQGDRIFLKHLLAHKKELFCWKLNYDKQGNLINVEEKEAEFECINQCL